MMSSTPVIGGVIILNKSGFHRLEFLPDLLLLKSVYFRDQNRFLVSSIRFKVLVQYVWVVTSTKKIYENVLSWGKGPQMWKPLFVDFVCFAQCHF